MKASDGDLNDPLQARWMQFDGDMLISYPAYS